MIDKPSRATLFLLLFLSIPALAADPVQGKITYQSLCVRCHNPSQRPIKTPPSRIPDELHSRTFSAHHFILTDAELENLAEYLETADGAGVPPR